MLEIEMGAHLQNISERLGRAQNGIEARTGHMNCSAKRRLPDCEAVASQDQHRQDLLGTRAHDRNLKILLPLQIAMLSLWLTRGTTWKAGRHVAASCGSLAQFSLTSELISLAPRR